MNIGFTERAARFLNAARGYFDHGSAAHTLVDAARKDALLLRDTMRGHRWLLPATPAIQERGHQTVRITGSFTTDRWRIAFGRVEQLVVPSRPGEKSHLTVERFEHEATYVAPGPRAIFNTREIESFMTYACGKDADILRAFQQARVTCAERRKKRLPKVMLAGMQKMRSGFHTLKAG